MRHITQVDIIFLRLLWRQRWLLRASLEPWQRRSGDRLAAVGLVLLGEQGLTYVHDPEAAARASEALVTQVRARLPEFFAPRPTLPSRAALRLVQLVAEPADGRVSADPPGVGQ